jgi:galactonate dehydratase
MVVDAVVPNFLIQEQVDAGLGNGLLKKDWQVIDGHIPLWTTPGLGFDVDEAEVTKAYTGEKIGYHRELGGEYYYDNDNSVADW